MTTWDLVNAVRRYLRMSIASTVSIQERARIARPVIAAPEFQMVEAPPAAGADIDRLGMLGRLGVAISHDVRGVER